MSGGGGEEEADGDLYAAINKRPAAIDGPNGPSLPRDGGHESCLKATPSLNYGPDAVKRFRRSRAAVG